MRSTLNSHAKPADNINVKACMQVNIAYGCRLVVHIRSYVHHARGTDLYCFTGIPGPSCERNIRTLLSAGIRSAAKQLLNDQHNN